MKKTLIFCFSILIVSIYIIVNPRVACTQTVTPSLSFTPNNQSVQQGSPVTVDIFINNITDLGGFDFMVTFNPALLQIPTNGVTIQTQFFTDDGRSLTPFVPIINNTAGTVRIGAYSPGLPPGASGTGRLATLTFNTINAGTATLNFQNIEFGTPLGDSISVNTSTGQINITSSQSPSPTPTRSPSPTPTRSPSATPTVNPTPTPTRTPSPTPTRSPLPSPTRSPSPTPSQSPTPTPSPSYVINDLIQLLIKFLTGQDSLYKPIEGKVNMLDAAWVIRWLQ